MPLIGYWKKKDMDNESVDKKKSKDDRIHDAPSNGSSDTKSSNSSQPDFSKETIGAYDPALSQHAWEQRRPWNSTPYGRLAIRCFSRGMLGAVFFTGGGMLSRKWLHSDAGERYDPNAPWSHQIFPEHGGNPLRFMAKLIDTVAGKPIEFTVNMLGGNGEKAVRFRPTKFRGHPGSDHTVRGRSLGNEASTVTFDFFCMSIGDAWGRDIAGWIDPNVKQDWMHDGKIDVPKAVKATAKALWRYTTYNGGEDWAVAVPYVYFMKGHRALINSHSPGFAYDFDRNLNGGSFKVNNNHEVVGSFNKEGILDLQNRFVVYNMGTLLFREAYEYVGKKIHGHHAVLYGDPDPEHHQKKGVVGTAGDLAKWMVRGVIKGAIYMTPSVPFFWITRTPQTNYRGTFIRQSDESTLSYRKLRSDKPKYENVYANEMAAGQMTSETPVYYARYSPSIERDSHHQYIPASDWLPGRTANPLAKGFDPYHRTVKGPADSVLNGIGWASNQARHSLDNPARWADENWKFGQKIKSGLGMRYRARDGSMKLSSWTRFTHPMIHASLAYTPYMYSKAEFANLWDNSQMDVATERLIEGGSHLNWGEFKAGAHEMWRAFVHRPFAEEKRQEVADHRKEIESRPENPMTANLGEGDIRRADFDRRPNWQDRVISAPKTKPEGHSGAVERKSQASHVEHEKVREEMRKALEELNPPTNSIN